MAAQAGLQIRTFGIYLHCTCIASAAGCRLLLRRPQFHSSIEQPAAGSLQLLNRAGAGARKGPKLQLCDETRHAVDKERRQAARASLRTACRSLAECVARDEERPAEPADDVRDSWKRSDSVSEHRRAAAARRAQIERARRTLGAGTPELVRARVSRSSSGERWTSSLRSCQGPLEWVCDCEESSQSPIPSGAETAHG